MKLKKGVAVMRGLQSKVNQMTAVAVSSSPRKRATPPPVRSDALTEIEADPSAAVDELQSAIVDGDSNATKQLCRKASNLLAERNRLCKLNKT